MGRWEQIIKQLGVELPKVASPVGSRFSIYMTG